MLDYSDPIPVGRADKARFLKFAEKVAREAGAATLPFFRSEVSVENKRTDGHFDPVTQADRAAEKIIRQAIESSFPDHGILGEEFGHKPGNGLTWVIDPIDGTRAFMAGFLHWGVLIGLFDGRRPVVGVMYQPYTGELFSGDGSRAEYLRGGESRALHTSSVTDLEHAVLCTTTPKLFTAAREREGLERLERRVKLARYGGDCYIYAMLAMGFVDVALDANLNAYDVQALIPIVEGAGGQVSAVGVGDASMGGLVVASATPQLHARVLSAFDQED